MIQGMELLYPDLNLKRMIYEAYAAGFDAGSYAALDARNEHTYMLNKRRKYYKEKYGFTSRKHT